MGLLHAIHTVSLRPSHTPSSLPCSPTPWLLPLQSSEPALASNLYSTILAHPNLERSMAFLLGNKLANPTMLGMQLMRLMQEAYEDDPSLMDACLADLQVGGYPQSGKGPSETVGLHRGEGAEGGGRGRRAWHAFAAF